MKIVIIGGTGLIGSKTVERLRKQGHEVIAASPNTGVNTITGEGLAEALVGHRSRARPRQLAVLRGQGRARISSRLRAAICSRPKRLAGVKHHIALSVVGTERLQESGYFRGKLAQEKLIKASGIPYTIVHSTQFMEFLGGIAQVGHGRRSRSTCRRPMCSRSLPTTWPTPWPDVALAAPANGTIEIAGPERVRASASSSPAI